MIVKYLKFIFYHLSTALCLALFCLPVQSAEVRAYADRTSLSVGESFNLTISIRGGEGTADMSVIREFSVISRGTSTSVQFVNGQVSRETGYNYTLIPMKEGRLKIPPIPVAVDGKTVYTEEIVVEVSQSGQQSGDTNSRSVFIQASVSNPTPYQGEQLIYTFRLYHAVQIANARLQKPEFSGFTAKEIGESKKTFRQTLYGMNYQVTEILYVLVPLHAGEQTIDSAVLECDVVMRRRNAPKHSPFDSFFDDPIFGQAQLEPRILKTEPIPITVKPLPAFTGGGKFSGLVGAFSIQAETDRKDLTVGDSVTLSVIVEGTGNIVDAAEPEIPIPDSFKVYKDSPQEDIQTTSSGYTGKKVFRMALVPTKHGDFTLNPIKLSFFDVSKGSYETRSTPAISFVVKPTENTTPTIVSATPPTLMPLKKAVEFTGRDILPIKEELSAIENRKPLTSVHFVLWMVMPMIAFIAFKAILTLTQKARDLSSLMMQKSETALKEARNASGEVLFSCLYKALIYAILSKAGVKGESLTYAEAQEILKSRGYADEVSELSVKLLEKIESAKFSGRAADKVFTEALLSETGQLIRRLA